MLIRPAAPAALLLVLAAACGRDGGVVEPPPAQLSIAAGAQSFSGPAGSRVRALPLARVIDAASEPVKGVTVRLSLGADGTGGASLPEDLVVTGPDGVARGDVQLGNSLGTVGVTAVIDAERLKSVSVTITATPAPAVGSVSPNSFGAGDIVQIAGTGLGSVPNGQTVLFGGVPGLVVSGAGATSLSVRVPACVTPGAVAIRVVVGDTAPSNVVTGTYVSDDAPLVLAQLEGLTVPAAQAEQCVTLAGGGARYLVVPQYATPEQPTFTGDPPPATSFLLGNAAGSAVASVQGRVEQTAAAPQQRLDATLRRREHVLAPMAAASGPNPPMDVFPLAAVTVGSKSNFNVLSNLEDDEAFETVTATVKFAGDNILIYLDDASPTGFTDAELNALGRTFDDKLYPMAVENFGSESDIDRNDRTIVLMTPVVNQLTESTSCDGGFISGFFYGLDLIPSLANSNGAEIFYSLVPDPQGQQGCDYSVSAVRGLVPATFVHELQHMISFNQHVLVRRGMDEDPWLNEGLSHMAEELASLLYERDPSQPRQAGAYFPDSSQGFINGNLASAYDYLVEPRVYSLTNFTGFGELPERGAAWIFMRWLGDQYGDGIFRRLVESELTGAQNVADRTGAPFARLMAEFSVALYAANLPEATRASLPRRFQFQREFQRIYARLNFVAPSLYPRVYPVVANALPLGGAVVEPMIPGTQDWYLLETSAGTPSATLRFTGEGGTPLPAALVPQVTVFRLP